LKRALALPPINIDNPSWLTIPALDALPHEVDDEVGPIAGKIGIIPNVARVLAVTPRHLVRW
jgi:hypothetical protein